MKHLTIQTLVSSFLLLLILSACSGRKTTEATKWNDPSNLEQRIDSVLKMMTLEEKIGQMNLLTSDWELTGPSLRKDYVEFIKSGRVGSIFNAHTAAYTRSLQKIAMEETRMKIPLLFGYDVIHGHRTIFPISLGESASWDLEAIETGARVAAIEAAASGLHWTFAPMVDIARDPRWGRISEGAGEDTYLGCEIAKARVRGFQGDDLGAVNTILACAKHYAAYGAAQAGRDYHTVDLSDRVLRDIYLPPFKAALDAGVATFMTSFNELDGVPATGNAYLLDKILRKEWKFGGFVVTDYTSINEMVPHGVAANLEEAVDLAVNAGVDMDMQGLGYDEFLLKLVKAGKVSEKKIDDAVRRILAMKFRLGLFEDPYRYCDEEREKKEILSAEHLEKARDVARKSFVLLKNNNQTLPISKDKKIALIGSLADSKADMLGSWFASGKADDVTTIFAGLKAEYPNTNYVKGCEVNDTDRSGFSAAVSAARNADVVVFVMGEKGEMSGEAASRSDINVPGVQTELLAELKKTGKPVVVLLANGRPLTLEKEFELSDAMLEIWFPGTQAGQAVADVLCGAYNPSGKLPVTYPRNLGQVPIFYNLKNTGRPIDETKEEKYKSKYLDVPNSPLFPFGYGLSYTTFEYSDITLNKKEIFSNDSLEISLTISNTGNFDGSEVVQMYVRDLVGSVTRPVKELKGFKKIFIPKGNSTKVTFVLKTEDLAFTRSDNTWGTEPGEFEIFVGTDSQQLKSTGFSLK